jgi:peptidoglycan/LPS O-acetylase OafA/YrhL
MAGRSLTVAAPARAVADDQAGTRPATGRIRELDGIRAIAILSVLVGHALADPRSVESLQAGHHWTFAERFFLGHLWLGVDLFFVLSGFLITGILLETRDDDRYYRNFYIRRALRILPVLLVFLAFVALVYHGPAAYFFFALLFCANFVSWLNVGTPPGAGPLWSLGVEEQFYLLWPTLVRHLKPRMLLAAAIGICVAVPILRAVADDHNQLLLTWMRCDGLALGALLAVWVHHQKPSRSSAKKIIAVALGLAIGLFALETLVGSPRLTLALRTSEADLFFAAGLIAAYVWQGSPATAPLRSGVAVFVAGTSYCAYVIHLSVYNAVDAFGWTASSSTLTSGLLRLAFGVPIVFALAALSKRFLEDPFLRLKSVLAPQKAPV